MNHNPWRTTLVTAVILTLAAGAVLFIVNALGHGDMVVR